MEILIKKISKKFGNKKILDNVSLTIRNNDFIHLQGKNGTGKTTLLKIIKGVIIPDSGQIIKKSSKIELITNNQRSFFLRLSLIDNLIFFSGLSGRFDKNNLLKKIKYYKEHFGLKKEEDIQMMNFSSGEIKKALIIRALIREPDILLMDEICTNLDLNSKEKILKYIKEIHIKSGKSVVWVDHNTTTIDNLISKIHNLDTK